MDESSNVNEPNKLVRHLITVYVNFGIFCFSTTSGIQASFYLTNVFIAYLPPFLTLLWLIISIIIATKTSNRKLRFSLLLDSQLGLDSKSSS
ncbi:26608_t:CDS:2 [Dentiscutata erythropus]|uniref:26608_t:CDS:1 n=1 Tax=Dentiscutata erythropus TaxID=1348616 RepID=A0A9N9DC34_9GLOM|nr:26608_t:CDS:2 [Dentiscutata erythropus]